MKILQVPFITMAVLFFSCNKDKEGTEPVSSIPATYFTFSGQIGTNDNSTIVSSDNNLLICGNENGNICLLKISKSGTQLWRKSFTAGNNSEASAIVEAGNQDLLLIGRTSRNYTVSNWDILLVKTNSTGDTLWSKTYGNNGEDYGYHLIKTNDDNYLISGITYAPGGGFDIYLVKVNSNGDTLWTNSYPNPDQEVPFHVMQSLNGEYLITGTNEDNSQPRGLYLLKVDANGNQLWQRTVGPGTWRWGYSTIELANGDLLTCGHHTSNGNSQLLLLKTDPIGNEIWQREFGNAAFSEKANSIRQNSDSSFTITGSSYDVATMQDDIVLLKVDQNGTLVWFKKFGGVKTESGINLSIDTNGDNMITGTTYSYGANASAGNIFMTKTDDNGNFK